MSRNRINPGGENRHQGTPGNVAGAARRSGAPHSLGSRLGGRMRTAAWLSGLMALGIGAFIPVSPAAEEGDRPNILWISAEDMGPHLGAYGDPNADTPNLDDLASDGMVYNHVWSDVPVCAPARTGLITGVYASSLGAEHMRSFVPLPEGWQLFPQYLRDAGYFTSNKSKEDFNVPKPGTIWDQRGGDAHWKNREEGQPFFSVFNSGTTHESNTGHGNAQVEGDHPEMDVPAFHPDIPEARRNWATYYQRIAEMDAWAGQRLREVAEAGLQEETIIFFWGDHGPGLPRGKRWTYDFGLRVPLIVYIPPKYRDRLAPPEYEPGGAADRLVSFVDFGPTVLSLAGIRPPDHMQGKAFMGEYEASPRDYLFGLRGRMDERIDRIRTVRDERFQLIFNYMPHRVYGQHLQYLHRNPTMDKWQRLFEQGEIDPPASFYWQEKPTVELYDLETDPDQVRNLAYDPRYQSIRRRLMDALRTHQQTIRDVGLLPEAQIHERPDNGEAPYDLAHDPGRYPLDRIREMAERAARRDMKEVPRLVEGLAARDSAIRYWAVTGLLNRGSHAVWPNRDRLRDTLKNDEAPTVRAVAAEALVRYGDQADRQAAWEALVKLGNPQKTNAFSAVAALNAIDHLGEQARVIHEELKEMPKRPENGPRRASGYTERLLTKILADLEE